MADCVDKLKSNKNNFEIPQKLAHLVNIRKFGRIRTAGNHFFFFGNAKRFLLGVDEIDMSASIGFYDAKHKAFAVIFPIISFNQIKKSPASKCIAHANAHNLYVQINVLIFTTCIYPPDVAPPNKKQYNKSCKSYPTLKNLPIEIKYINMYVRYMHKIIKTLTYLFCLKNAVDYYCSY